MEEKLARLIFDNVKNNIDINDDFIKKVIGIVIQEWNILNYDGNYNICHLNNKLASYNCYKKCLSIDNDLINNINKMYTFFSYELLHKYQFLLQVILHELKHCLQFEITDDKHENLENLIAYSENIPKIKFCNNGMILRSKLIKQIKLMKKYYLYSPIERIAEIDSAKIVKNISEILNDNYTNNIMNFIMLYNYIRGYDSKNENLVPPTPYYLTKIKSDKNLNKIIVLGSSQDENSKLRLGLDLNVDYFLNMGDEFKLSYDKVKKHITAGHN